ncbi:hypothetical protein J2S49_000713 [Arcanobacterium wilhelmae]|uniref:CAAX prenyl protease 2/Lysostaphin resistance protein A-like domain-containing protein n=1 Tax=Arcanobacterium wilhelmae TaxID=1803177 RepID=A0ABT9NA90_9ACTO|nr:CPBP family glutamic-type intramembrane protease [Arcanobacterium wilhelmae]MDP9800637.1 hypothetical protein [Arcanobacterium wilhelmae]WFN90043.1 hypothetical protein P8A24_07565 [Arcanobacterium wilhelmae]
MKYQRTLQNIFTGLCAFLLLEDVLGGVWIFVSPRTFADQYPHPFGYDSPAGFFVLAILHAVVGFAALLVVRLEGNLIHGKPTKKVLPFFVAIVGFFAVNSLWITLLSTLAAIASLPGGSWLFSDFTELMSIRPSWAPPPLVTGIAVAAGGAGEEACWAVCFYAISRLRQGRLALFTVLVIARCLLHLHYGSIPYVIPISALGIFAIIYLSRGGSPWALVAAHATWNFSVHLGPTIGGPIRGQTIWSNGFIPFFLITGAIFFLTPLWRSNRILNQLVSTAATKGSFITTTLLAAGLAAIASVFSDALLIENSDYLQWLGLTPLVYYTYLNARNRRPLWPLAIGAALYGAGHVLATAQYSAFTTIWTAIIIPALAVTALILLTRNINALPLTPPRHGARQPAPQTTTTRLG